MDSQTVTVTIYRSTEAGQVRQTYEVPYEQRHSVLTLLNYIYENQDPTLGYRHYTCGRGLCNSCRMNVNGRVRKSCATRVSPGEHLVLKPHRETLIYDLATVIGGGPFREVYGDD